MARREAGIDAAPAAALKLGLNSPSTKGTTCMRGKRNNQQSMVRPMRYKSS